jgi:hypothetical protein
MMAFGAFEILILMFLGGGGLSTDLVSALDAKSYFQSRNVEVTTDKLVELATKDPTDGKTQIAQLLALRTLAEDAAKVKKAKNYQEILAKIEEVAEGKKAQDPQGFAAEYGKMAAVALGSRRVEPPVLEMPENSARQDAFTWFPDSVKIVAAMDFRSGQVLSPDGGKAMRQMMFGGIFFPGQALAEVANLADKFGNVRADRVAIAFTPDPQNPQHGRIYVRITGKGDPRRIVEVIKQEGIKGTVVKELKGFRGQRVITVQPAQNRGPGMALVGDTDFLIAGHDGGPQANQMEVLDEVLAVRAGRAKNVLSGPLGASLKKLSPRANAVAAGELPDELRNGLMQPPGFTVFPSRVLAEMIRNKNSAKVRWEGKLKDADDAKAFVADVDRLKKMGIEGLKEAKQKLPPGLPLPPKTFEILTKVLESVKAEARGAEAHGTVTVPVEALKLITTFGALGAAAPPAVPAPPIPPPKVEAKPLKKGASLRVPGRDAARAALCPGPVLTRPGPAIPCLHEYADRG